MKETINFDHLLNELLEPSCVIADMSGKLDFSTWLGCAVRPSPDYPGRVFLTKSLGLAALEAHHDDCFWAAKIRVDGYVGHAIARERAEARLEAEKKLLEALLQDSNGRTWLSALHLLRVLNPALIN